MFDPRRRAMLWEIVPFLAEFFADKPPSLPPPLIVTAASRVIVRPTTSMRLLYTVQALCTPPVVTGIIVAVVTVPLRVSI